LLPGEKPWVNRVVKSVAALNRVSPLAATRSLADVKAHLSEIVDLVE